MTIDYLKKLLQRYSIRPNKILGQNFLMDEVAMEDMIDAAKVVKGDQVIEIGPGIGTLTQALLDRGVTLLSIEKDPTFLPILRKLAKEYPNFWYEIGDALKFDYRKAQTTQPYKIIANIPYYITGKLIQTFLHLEPKPQSITLLVQKEVARNIAAKPPRMNLLGISVQILGEPEIAGQIPARFFYPSPKVDSSVVHIEIPKKAPYTILDEKLFWRVLRACFSGKRKQIHNTLRNNLHLDPEVVSKILNQTGIDPATRPQSLSIRQWIVLVNAAKLYLTKN